MATHSSVLAWRIPMERGAWRAAVHGVAELDTPERVSTSIFLGDVALEELHEHGHENWSLFVPTSLRQVMPPQLCWGPAFP